MKTINLILFAIIFLSSSFPSSQNSIVEIDSENFTRLLSQSSNWFVIFVASWCVHCEPLENKFIAASTLYEGEVSFGKVDCNENYEICDSLKIDYLPSLVFFSDQTAHRYLKDDPTESDLLSFTEKMSHPVLSKLTNLDSIPRHLSQNYTVFIVATPNQMTREGSIALIMPFAIKYKSRSYFYMADTTWLIDELRKRLPSPLWESMLKIATLMLELKHPVILAGIDPETSVFLPCDPFQKGKLQSWIRKNTMSLISELSELSYQDLLYYPKKTAIAAVNLSNPETTEFFQLYRQVAKNYTDFIIFSWINVDKWAKFLEQYHLDPAKTPSILFIDSKTEEYYVKTDNMLDLNSLSTFLDQVKKKQIKSKSRLSAFVRLTRYIKQKFSFAGNHLVKFIVSIFALILAFLFLLKNLLNKNKDQPNNNNSGRKIKRNSSKEKKKRKKRNGQNN
ncbi:protein disulfide-isomerase tmx3 [Anaeramoeba ignava]|uniref:Protein disulfide-isomerase tmx3 n=1 Tax=Anaeramoeba ignava TaxID=1746090 RepID=A0A9Q0LHQ1_ANAIG|nr:protein disulfide-isomerase tmx3 [Anaeramoeba ignava]